MNSGVPMLQVKKDMLYTYILIMYTLTNKDPCYSDLPVNSHTIVVWTVRVIYNESRRS